MASNSLPYVTEEEYLALERKSEIRHEYYRGEIFAMAGGTGEHASLASELLIEIGAMLRAKPCRAVGSDLRIYIPATGLYTYPDISVTCGEPRYRDNSRDTLLNPVAIIEVLSPSTASYDRGDKFRQYQTIPTLRTYILVSHDRMRVEKFTRGADNTWVYRAYEGDDAILDIEEPPLSVPLTSIYRRVTFPTS